MTEIGTQESQALDFLARLGGQPAVAFYESGVASTVESILNELALEHRRDSFGNIVARLSGSDPTVTPIAIVAHMDHPGFEITGRHENEFIATALGGVPPSSFAGGVPLQVLLPDGNRAPAVATGRHGAEAERLVRLKLTNAGDDSAVQLPAAAVFDLVDFELDGNYIRMRAVDDLAGCGAALAALARLASGEKRPQGDVYGLFTRAEEVGLVGARLAAEAGELPPETIIVSAESSRTLPGAEQGGGPVVRVGDAGFTFNADAESVLIRAREALQEGQTGFKVQRQLMSGGVCEASAFALYGYQTTGIAFPLGNYHNAAPAGKIEAEYIHIDDYLGGVALMEEAAHQVSERTNTAFRQRLRQVPQGLRQRLLDTAG